MPKMAIAPLTPISHRGRPPRAILACLALAVGFMAQGGAAADVESIRAKYGAMVTTVAQEMADRYARLADLVDPDACGCSHHVCGNQFPEGSCVDNGHVGEVDAGEVDCGGHGLCGRTKMNLNMSSIRTPNDLIQTSPQLHEDVVRDICMTKDLEDVFMRVTNFTDEFIPWMYFASVHSGLIRTWPLMPSDRDEFGDCVPYDPRVRPWYKVGTSEPKNVVIVVQASDSMGHLLHVGTSVGSPSRWSVAKEAVASLLLTLDSANDKVNVVVFNGRPASLLGDRVEQANEKNVQRLMKALEGVELRPGADNAAAMDMAFDLLEGTDLKSCQNIIIHIGDGDDCTLRGQGNCSLAQAAAETGRLPNGIELNLEAVEERQRRIEESSSRAAIFTFTVEAGDDSLGRQLACANGGVWSMLDGRGEPLNKMGAYFQYLSFSMEPRNNDDPLAVFSPIYEDAWGLGNMTTVVAPVFVVPKCANGSTSEEKLLLGVVGKDVTVRELREQGLKEAQVSVMINENLSQARACDEDYKYSICKMQVLRGSTSAQRFPAECPTRKWVASSSQTCHKFRDKHYLLVPEPQSFGEAQKQCQDMGGMVAEIGAEHAEEEQHLLASLAPPDGAWLGLQPINNEWVWVGSMRQANATRDKMWFTEPPKNAACRAGFIDPRGILHSVGAKTCPIATAAICEFHATVERLPPACQGDVQTVAPEDLSLNTSKSCLQSGECNFSDGVEISEYVLSSAVCPLESPEPYSSLVCCADEDLPEECFQQDSALQAQNETATKGAGGASSQIIGLGAALSITFALFVTFTGVLLLRLFSPGTFNRMCGRFCRRPDAGDSDPEIGRIPMAVSDSQKDVGHVLLETMQWVADQRSWLAGLAPHPPPSEGIPTTIGKPADDGSAEEARTEAPPAHRGSGEGGQPSPEANTPPSPEAHYSLFDMACAPPLFKDGAPQGRESARLPLSLRSIPFDDIKNVAIPVNGSEASGGHGVVREGVWTDGEGIHHKVAVKSAKDLLREAKVAAISKEFDILRKVPPHDNIVWVVGARLSEEPIIVEEWVPGNLEKRIKEHSLTYGQILRISLGVARGLDHLHENRVVHFDVKPGNILLDGDCAKLADYSCSRFKAASTISLSFAGTLGYMAPECFLQGYLNETGGPDVKREHYSAQRIDVYSLGKVMLRCVTFSLDAPLAEQADAQGSHSEDGVGPPTERQRLEAEWQRLEAQRQRLEAERVCREAGLSLKLWALILQCIETIPERRPKCKEVVARLEDMANEPLGGLDDWRWGRPSEELWSAFYTSYCSQ